jgi:hypothetical protein
MLGESKGSRSRDQTANLTPFRRQNDVETGSFQRLFVPCAPREHKLAAISYKLFKNYRRRASLQRQARSLTITARATISYLGKGSKNGHGDELEREKIEGLRLQNAISKTRLRKLQGDVIDRKEVEFVVSSALVTLRSKFCSCPS